MTRYPILHRALYAVVLALSAAPAVRSQADNVNERRAYLTVRVQKDATLTVDGTETKQKGEVRRFYSPPLEPGKKYHYTLVADWWNGNNYENFFVRRTVDVQAGTKIEIDMTRDKWDPEKGDTLIISYVPTPQETVDAMMKLAKVGKDDVVYDLGCGDGRLVVTAVKKFNAKRGVGIDRDPERIKEAKANAKKAGVEDKVEFRQDDIFATKDISKATVVTLYLSDSLNEKLRDSLFKQLKPGTRIVSHRFRMGDWKPEKTEMVDIDDPTEDEKLIFLWTIPKK
jgi:uncharacterized protein (TIGR03000 family)